MSRRDIDGQTSESRLEELLSVSQSSWLLTPMGSSLDEVSFHLSGEQALVELLYLLWGAGVIGFFLSQWRSLPLKKG